MAILNKFSLAPLLIIALQLAMGTVSKADNGDAEIILVGRVSTDTLSVTIREGQVTLGSFDKYQARDGDEFKGDPPGTTLLIRNGNAIGTISGTKNSPARFVRGNDSYTGRRANRSLLTDHKAWSIQINGKQIPVTKAFRKSRILDIAETVQKRPEVCFEHNVFLKFATSLDDGELRVSSKDEVIEPFQTNLSVTKTVSESIHVSLNGFRPDDTSKVAFLSCWMGDGGPLDYEAYDALPQFAVVESATGKTIFKGQATLWRKADQVADHRGLQGTPDGRKVNYAGTPTYLLDFSQITSMGKYRLIVEGIGSSRAFPVGLNVYEDVLNNAIVGLEAHRWGEERQIKLVDGTEMHRPAAVPANHSDSTPVFETSAIYTNANFEDFEPGKIGPWQPKSKTLNVVGGFMDAGDYDRNHSHWKVGYYLLDLASRAQKNHPQLSARLIENALWDIQFWEKIQNDDGGVPSAVEYSEHPRDGEPSWLNTLPLYVCAPSRDGNFDFATSASKAAAVLKASGKTERANQLTAAAERALSWVERQKLTDPDDQESKLALIDAEMLARVELWNATRQAEHRKKALALSDQRALETWSSVYPDGLLALLTILEMPKDVSALSDSQREKIEGTVKRTIEMNYLEGSTERSPFQALKNGWVGIGYGNGSWPTTDSLSVLRAWHLWGEEKHLNAAVSGMAYCMGGNPNNLIYITSGHERSVKNVLHCDTRFMGRRAPIGIPVYGPSLTSGLGSAWPLNWHLAGDQTIFPKYQMWPTYENVHEFWKWGSVMEYTVHQSHASAIYLAGMLHVREPVRSEK